MINHVGWVYSVERHFQQYFSYIVAVSFGGMKPEYPEKSSDLSQFTDKLYHVISSTPRHERGSNSQLKC